MAMNNGAMMAESQASRATIKPKIEPVPVVSTKRQIRAIKPAVLAWRFIRRSICSQM